MRSSLGGCALIVIILVVLMGCTLLGTSTSAARPMLRQDVQQRVDEALVSQQSALALWDRVIEGQIVSCQESIPVPSPLDLNDQTTTAYPSSAQLQAEYNAAVEGLRNAAQLWDSECGDERAFVPLSRAREGRTSAALAGEELVAAQVLLDAWPVE